MKAVNEYTKLVQPLIEILKRYQSQDIYVSNVRDKFDNQYVNLVQEGGGIYGIALTGYTYILERFKIKFLNTAGTSAGSINTLLLGSVLSKEEIDEFQTLEIKSPIYRLPKDQEYYDTRTEKIIELIEDSEVIQNFVDAHPIWRKIILFVFSKKICWKFIFITLGLVTLVTIFISQFSTLLSSFSIPLFKVLVFINFLGLGLFIAYTLFGFFARMLWLFAGKFGINPGDKFYQWVDNTLKYHNIYTVEDLKAKLQFESDNLGLRYSNPYISLNKSLIIDDLQNTSSFPQAQNPINFQQKTINILSQSVETEEKMEQLRQFSHQYHSEKKIKIFKEMAIISSDIINKMKVELPADHKFYWGNNYEISPAHYLRASMSIPFFFQTYTVDMPKGLALKELKWVWQEERGLKLAEIEKFHFVDGGMLSNFPIDIFLNSEISEIVPSLGIKLAYYKEKELEKFTGFISRLIATMRSSYDRSIFVQNKILNKSVRTIDVGDISWLNFNITKIEKQELFVRGALTACIFLIPSILHSSDPVKRREIENKLIEKANELLLSIGVKKESIKSFKYDEKEDSSLFFEWNDYQDRASSRFMEIKNAEAKKSRRASYDPLFKKSKS